MGVQGVSSAAQDNDRWFKSEQYFGHAHAVEQLIAENPPVGRRPNNVGLQRFATRFGDIKLRKSD